MVLLSLRDVANLSVVGICQFVRAVLGIEVDNVRQNYMGICSSRIKRTNKQARELALQNKVLL